jgi:hypothetical protein
MASQNTSVLISSIFNSRKTILEIMDKLDYNVNEYSNFSISEVNSMKQNNQFSFIQKMFVPGPIQLTLYLSNMSVDIPGQILGCLYIP